MKYLLILADGMADYKIAELGDRTPLQAARTPNLDRLALSSEIGLVRTIPEGFPPGSDVANLSMMGYAPEQYYTGRSPLEAVSMGVELGPNDLAIRCNLVTVSAEPEYGDKTMVDYSSGEISSAESAVLIAAVKKELDNEQFSFHAGISYRNLLIWKNGAGKSLQLTPPHDISGRKVGGYLPQGADSNPLLELMVKSERILAQHPINEERRARGHNPATSIWLWGQGTRPALDSFRDKYGIRGSVVSAVDLVKGLGICAGLKPVTVAGATGAIITNFAGKAEAALNELKQGQDFVYLHIESPDEAGHQGELEKKIWAIEQVDKEVVGRVIAALDQFDDIRIMIAPDHPTPIAVRTHTSEPVPFLIYDKNHTYPSPLTVFDEESALLGRFYESGPQLMERFIKG
ncbi:MAG: cofactor-independent phosphoglycerate mutase [Syntrophomonadaceae bacterium]